MKKYAFGVDIGGTTCKLGFFDTSGVLLDKWEIPTNTADYGTAILSDVASSIENKLVMESVCREDVQGIGVGVPGAVTDYRVVHGCENLGWKDVNVAEELERLTGFHIKVENDANMAVLGETWKGTAAGSKDVLLVTLGTGVGAGILSGGSIITGFAGGAGEIGHMTVNCQETRRCNCGKYGCLEQYASATGIIHLAKQRAARAQDAGMIYDLSDTEKLTAKEIFDAAKKGNTDALAVTDEFCEILGIALANVACVLNPEVIVIGGGVSKAGDFLLRRIQNCFEKNVFYTCKNVRFALASLGNEAGIWGCVRALLS